MILNRLELDSFENDVICLKSSYQISVRWHSLLFIKYHCKIHFIILKPRPTYNFVKRYKNFQDIFMFNETE